MDVSKTKVPYNSSACWANLTTQSCEIHSSLSAQPQAPWLPQKTVNVCWMDIWMGNTCFPLQGSSFVLQSQWLEKSLPRAGAAAKAQGFCLDWPRKGKNNEVCLVLYSNPERHYSDRGALRCPFGLVNLGLKKHIGVEITFYAPHPTWRRLQKSRLQARNDYIPSLLRYACSQCHRLPIPKIL